MSPSSTLLLTTLLALSTAMQASAQSASASATDSAAVPSSPSQVATAVPTVAVSPVASGFPSVTSINTATIDTSNLPASPVATSLPFSYSVPPLSAIVQTLTATTVPLESTFPAGSTPTGVSAAPPIPTAFPLVADFPQLDRLPPTNSSMVQKWISEIDFSQVPSLGQTTGACATSPQAVTETDRCWWTCGGCTRSTDITVCQDQFDWGLSYDDGPSPYTPLLLNYLNDNDIKTTFFVVGSRVLSRPEMLISEYMSGHQISVHTWSHPYLTNLTNEEIVAELGWTKEVIRQTIGVTPRTFRPPYGDIDDRVRAIAAQMGLTPIIWTTAKGVIFDTDDWNIPAGTATGETSLARFDTILNTGKELDTGIIVLQHDLYPQCVDLAVGYVLPMAMNETSPWNLKSISQCVGWAENEAYIETASNTTTVDDPAGTGDVSFPVVYNSGSSSGGSGTTSGSGTTGGSRTTGSGPSGTATGGASTSTGAAGKAAVIGGPGLKGVIALGAVAFGAAMVL